MKKIIAILLPLSLIVFCFSAVWAAPKMPPEIFMLQSVFELKTDSGKGWTVYTVPNDKVLVIETISTRTILYQGETVVQAGLWVFNGTDTNVFMLPVLLHGCTGPWCYYNGTQQLRVYAGPGNQIGFVIQRSEVTSTDSTGAFYLSGYLMPKDSPSLAP